MSDGNGNGNNGNGNNGNGNNGNGKAVSYVLGILAAAGALAAIVQPMRQSIDDSRVEIKRVENDLKDAIRKESENSAGQRTIIEDRLREALASHISFSDVAKASLDSSIIELKERVRAVESALTENETQHKWIADIINTLKSEIETRTRTYWDGTKITYPDKNDEVLETIGEAQKTSGAK